MAPNCRTLRSPRAQLLRNNRAASKSLLLHIQRRSYLVLSCQRVQIPPTDSSPTNHLTSGQRRSHWGFPRSLGAEGFWHRSDCSWVNTDGDIRSTPRDKDCPACQWHLHKGWEMSPRELMWERRAELLRRQIEKDPYDAMFGASNERMNSMWHKALHSHSRLRSAYDRATESDGNFGWWGRHKGHNGWSWWGVGNQPASTTQQQSTQTSVPEGTSQQQSSESSAVASASRKQSATGCRSDAELVKDEFSLPDFLGTNYVIDPITMRRVPRTSTEGSKVSFQQDTAINIPIKTFRAAKQYTTKDRTSPSPVEQPVITLTKDGKAANGHATVTKVQSFSSPTSPEVSIEKSPRFFWEMLQNARPTSRVMPMPEVDSRVAVAKNKNRIPTAQESSVSNAYTGLVTGSGQEHAEEIKQSQAALDRNLKSAQEQRSSHAELFPSVQESPRLETLQAFGDSKHKVSNHIEGSRVYINKGPPQLLLNKKALEASWANERNLKRQSRATQSNEKKAQMDQQGQSHEGNKNNSGSSASPNATTLDKQKYSFLLKRDRPYKHMNAWELGNHRSALLASWSKRQQQKPKPETAADQYLKKEIDAQKAAMNAFENKWSPWSASTVKQKSDPVETSKTPASISMGSPTDAFAAKHKAQDNALVREIREIFENRYGTISAPAEPESVKTSLKEYERDLPPGEYDFIMGSDGLEQELRDPPKSLKSGYELPTYYDNKMGPSVYSFKMGQDNLEQELKMKSAFERPSHATKFENLSDVQATRPSTSLPNLSQHFAPSSQQNLATNTPTATDRNLYQILAWDQGESEMFEATASSSFCPPTGEKTLSVGDALTRLQSPSKFMTYLIKHQARGYDIVSASKSMLVLKRVRPADADVDALIQGSTSFGGTLEPSQTKNAVADEAQGGPPPGMNPIDGMPAVPYSLSPTGFVRYPSPQETDTFLSPPTQGTAPAKSMTGRRVRKEEAVFTGTQRQQRRNIDSTRSPSSISVDFPSAANKGASTAAATNNGQDGAAEAEMQEDAQVEQEFKEGRARGEQREARYLTFFRWTRNLAVVGGVSYVIGWFIEYRRETGGGNGGGGGIRGSHHSSHSNTGNSFIASRRSNSSALAKADVDSYPMFKDGAVWTDDRTRSPPISHSDERHSKDSNTVKPTSTTTTTTTPTSDPSFLSWWWHRSSELSSKRKSEKQAEAKRKEDERMEEKRKQERYQYYLRRAAENAAMEDRVFMLRDAAMAVTVLVVGVWKVWKWGTGGQ